METISNKTSPLQKGSIKSKVCMKINIPIYNTW